MHARFEIWIFFKWLSWAKLFEFSLKEKMFARWIGLNADKIWCVVQTIKSKLENINSWYHKNEEKLTTFSSINLKLCKQNINTPIKFVLRLIHFYNRKILFQNTLNLFVLNINFTPYIMRRSSKCDQTMLLQLNTGGLRQRDPDPSNRS